MGFMEVPSCKKFVQYYAHSHFAPTHLGHMPKTLHAKVRRQSLIFQPFEFKTRHVFKLEELQLTTKKMAFSLHSPLHAMQWAVQGRLSHMGTSRVW
jgi:hypothetical protein